MSPSDFAILREAVINDEGMRLVPYDDATGRPLITGDTIKGKITVGAGRNLTDVGITKGEALTLLENDLTNALAELTRAHPVVLTMAPVRQIVLANMAFNMGVPTLNTFRIMWAAIDRGNFDEAAIAMLDSKWAGQVGKRATRLASELVSGELK